MEKAKILVVGLVLVLANSAFAKDAAPTTASKKVAAATQEEWNPYDPRAEELLNKFDEVYEEQTGESAWLRSFMQIGPACKREQCPVWIQISKSTQKAYLYLNGVHSETWLVSTGLNRTPTINFDGNPNGRIYDRYTSTKFPEGDYKGLGNMPYAVFFKGGFAIHGTTTGNFKKLGQKASHGCVRMHPDHGRIFNRLVREKGIYNVWITVQP